jgi:hypothetical protein
VKLAVALLLGCVACTSNDASCPRDEPASCPGSGAPSYANDVAPLIQQYCVNECHNAQGSAFDQPLMPYDNLFGRRQDALDQLYDCAMPMAPAPQPTLTDRVTILTWFVCGAPNN